MRAAFGASSLSNSKRLAPSSVMKRVTPVAFPPGWLRLDTSPMVTGSPPSVNTIGMAEVAAFAASAALLPPLAAITPTSGDPPPQTSHERGRKPRQPVVSALRPLIVDRDVPAFDEAEIAQPAMK